MAVYIILAIIAYTIGSINFSVIISKKVAGFDVRKKGSGNAGSTNVLRAVGKKAAIITLLCDVLKGVVPALIAILVGNIMKEGVDRALLVQISSVAVVIGHTFPIFFQFRGGKGVATSLGIALVTNWKLGLICLVFALTIMALTRIVSLGSISAAVLYPVLTLFIHDNYIVQGQYFVFGIIMAVIIVFNHRSNLKRILAGNENRLSFKK